MQNVLLVFITPHETKSVSQQPTLYQDNFSPVVLVLFLIEYQAINK